MDDKHPGGAPTKYEPKFCKQVINLGRLGKSITQISAELDVSRSTIYNWQDEHPEFLDACKRAQELAQAWYEDVGQQGIWGGKDFNSTTWAKQVACRFPDDYTDKRINELRGKGDTSLVDPIVKAILSQVGVDVEDNTETGD